MPDPAQRRNKTASSRVGELKNAAKSWNNSYWTQLSWSDVAWGVGSRAGAVAYTIGKAIVMDQLKIGVLQKLSVDTFTYLGPLGSLARQTVGSLATYTSSEGADKLTTTSVDQIWGKVADALTGGVESIGSRLTSRPSSGTTGYETATGGGWDPVEAMPEIKNLFVDTLVTAAEVQAVSTAAQNGKMPFNYCDDAHALWARYYRTKENIDKLKEHCDKLEQFATRAKATIGTAQVSLTTLESQLTQLTETAVDSGQIPHYAGGGITSFMSRMGQCSNVKCQGPA